MQIIIPTLLVIGLTNIMGIQILVPLGKEKIVLYSQIAGVMVDAGLNMVLIPVMASCGAAIGTLAAEVVVWIIQFISLKDIVKELYGKVCYQLMMSAIMIASILSILIKHRVSGTFLTLCLSAIAFGGVYLGILTIFKEPMIYDIEKQLFDKIRTKI